jgi:hypothetical protein
MLTARSLLLLCCPSQTADATNFEHFEKELASEMARSTLFRMTLAQAKAFVRSYEVSRMSKGEKLSEAEFKALSELAVTIEAEVVKGLGESTLKQGFFVRLSTRSPKDALIFSAKMKEAVAADVKAVESKVGEGKISLNDKLGTIEARCRCLLNLHCAGIVYHNQVKLLPVRSGQEAVALLASSLRIYQDLCAHIEGQLGPTFDVFVVLRQWVDIRPAYEFRGPSALCVCFCARDF